MIGTVIDGRYEVLKELGAGAMGQVFECKHVGTGRHLALKIILNDALASHPDILERFWREARSAGSIDTRHIVEIVDTGTDPETKRPYLAMELMKGKDASDHLHDLGPLPPDVALRVVAQACVGLDKAHQAHVVHRDVKPANLFLAEQEDDDIVVKILDFGVAKVLADEEGGISELTRTGNVLGSPLYMAPEQARGKKGIDPRADVWSLGVVLYELCCGRTPFHDLSALGELIIHICSEPPPSLQKFAPWVSPEICAIAHTAMQIDREHRFQSTAEMLAAIETLIDEPRLRREDVMALPEEAQAPYPRRYDGQRWSEIGSASAPNPFASDEDESTELIDPSADDHDPKAIEPSAHAATIIAEPPPGAKGVSGRLIVAAVVLLVIAGAIAVWQLDIEPMSVPPAPSTSPSSES